MINIFIISTLIIGNRSKKKSYSKEIVNFKNFLDSLHNVTNELEVYEVLISLLKTFPLISYANVFYRVNSSEDIPPNWSCVNANESSICLRYCDSCPLTISSVENVVENVEKSKVCNYQFPDYKKGCFMCSTIVNIGQINDILHIYSESDGFFNEITVPMIKSYIEVVRLVINGKRTQNNLNKKASTDKLTNLFNRNFIDIYLDNQIEASNLAGQNLSIIMVDLDHYKSINDNFGHFAGDFVLIIFSEIVLKCVRKSDIVARYGGDEFLVVLPSTDTNTAEVIAERIRTTLNDYVLPPVDGVALPSLSCSLGISTYPIHCGNKSNLLKASDIALYSAKNSGRNCTKIFSEELCV